MPTTQASKNAEKQWARVLTEFKVTCERILRMGDYSQRTFDVKIFGPCDNIKSDAKYTKQHWRQNGMLDVVADKYCKTKADQPLGFFKHWKERGGKVLLNDRFAAALISYWGGYATKAELEAILNREPFDETVGCDLDEQNEA